MQEKNIVYGEELERTIFNSVGELLNACLLAHGENILQVDAETGEELSARFIRNRAICLARWFKSRNLKPNDVISVISENCLEYSVICVAALFEGITCAPLNPEYTKGELLHALNLSKPKIVFCSSSVLQKILQLLPTHPFIKEIVVLTKSEHPSVTIFSDIIRGATSDTDDESYTPAEINADETIATILCSSGTTGLPKGVMTTHANITFFVEVSTVIFENTSHGDLLLNGTSVGLIPFFHSFGFMQLLANTFRGRKIVVIRKFSPKLFLDVIVKYQVATLIIPAPVLIFLDKHPLVQKYDLSCLKEIKSGAAPLGADQETAIAKKFKLHISQGYGMTETTLGVLIVRPNTYKPGSVGQLTPGMMAKIIDENGIALGPNEKGELCFKGPLIMKGYIGDEKATTNAIDSDNWLHTGDVAYYDNEGFFYIVDRMKELIKYKAFQVAPAELEALLLRHPAVDDAAVVGLPDEEAGELPLAYVVRKTGVNVTAKEIQDYIANNVSPQKKLRGGVQFVNEIPKNPSGKILRRILKERAKALISKL